MAKNFMNKVNIDEQDYLSEEQKKKAKEEERKTEAKAKAFANAENAVDNSASAAAKKAAEKVAAKKYADEKRNEKRAAEESAALDKLDVREFLDKEMDPVRSILEYEPKLFGEEDITESEYSYPGLGKSFLDILAEERKVSENSIAYEKKIEQEKLEYLNIKEARDKKYNLEQELAELKEQEKNQNKKAGTVAIVSSALSSRGGNPNFADPELQKRIEELEKQISDMGKDITLAERAQGKKYLYNHALSAEDFDEYSAKPQKEEPEVIRPHQQNLKRETETLKGYMTEDEAAIYNYYLNKFGREKAEEFFESIEDDLNYRQAQAIFSGNEGKVLNEYIQGAAAGFESAKEGYKGTLNMLLGINEPQPTSTYQFLGGMAREDLAKSGIKLPEALGGASLGQLGYDLINTTANMLPSIMLGTLGGGAIGAAAIGASAAGNAYNEMLKAGYGKEQATNYAALVGASEASLGYLLGGIEATGGKLSKAALAKVLPKVDNALAKAAVNVGGKMLSEFSEEYLQEVLDPVFRNIALMEENKIDLLSPEAIYSGIMGALSAGGIAVFDGSVNVPEVLQKAEIPVPFGGKAQPGTEAALVADKISEIENRPISEAEKAAKMEEVMRAVAGTTKTPEVVAEAEKFKNIHEQKAGEPISAETEENVFGFKKYSEKQIENWAESKRITICDTFEKIKNFVNDAISGKNNKKAYFGAVTSDLAKRIQNETGINVENYNCSLGANEIRKIFKDHGDEKTESLRGQRAITVNDVFEIPNIIKNADNIKLSETEYRGKPAVEFRKNIDGSLVTVVGVVSDKHLDLFVQTEYAGNKKGNLVTVIGEQAPINTPKAARDTVSDNIIHPVSGFDNSSTIGNSVFGAGIFGKGEAEAVFEDRIAVVGGTNVDTEVPVPFGGKAQPGTEAALVADKISEIENRPISEAEKAAKMEEVMQAVAGTTGSAEVIAEAEKFRNVHRKRAEDIETKKPYDTNFNYRINGKVLPAKGWSDKRNRLDKIERRDIIEIQSGFACFPDEMQNEYAKKIKPEKYIDNGIEKVYFDVAMHGTPQAVGFWSEETNMSPRFLAEVITHNPKYEKRQKVRLLSCNTGEKIGNEYCFAEELANIMGVEVEAPNKDLYMYPNGKTKIGYFNEGEMVTYNPNDRGRFR